MHKDSAVSVAEYVEYLGTSVVPEVSVLEYWKHAGQRFPCLRELARDLLAVPASTVQTERENSKAKYVIREERNRLVSKTVQAVMCLKSWYAVLKREVIPLD